MTTNYKIRECAPYDKGAPNTFWITKETSVFGFVVSTKSMGDYKMDDTYGELGQMPFFNRSAAEERLRILNQ